ncbi:MAG: hypothetical protein HY904_06600 [Deltaproteobacteria bacterium]|nr:hypothetical protein [Deltaproteobacteria bacterium]
MNKLRRWQYVLFVVVVLGITFVDRLGALLQAWSAFRSALGTPTRAVSVMIVILLAYAGTAFYAKRYGLVLAFGGSKARISSLSPAVRRSVYVACLVVWIPSLVGVLSPPADGSRVQRTSDIVSRVFSRVPIPLRTGDRVIPFANEIFREWVFDIVAPARIEQIVIELGSRHRDDRVSVSPSELASVSEAAPKWNSGFQEPTRSTPDFWQRLIKIGPTIEGAHATVRVWRRVRQATELDVDDLVATGYADGRPLVIDTLNGSSGELRRKYEVLAANRYADVDGGLPLADHPGDAPRPTLQSSNEWRCVDAECTQVRLLTMGAQSSETPAETARRLLERDAVELQRRLELVLGCVTVDAFDGGPAGLLQFEVCVDGRKLYPADIEAVNSLLGEYSPAVPTSDQPMP